VSDIMKEFNAAQKLTKSIKKVMGKHYNTSIPCAGNVAALVKKCEEQEKALELWNNEFQLKRKA